MTMDDDATPQHDRRQADPLGLRGLPQLTPEGDDWPAIRAALEDREAPKQRQEPERRGPLAWLAAAACLLLVVGVLMNQDAKSPASGAMQGEHPAGAAVADAAPVTTGESPSVEDLIAMSQLLERRVRGLRARTGTMPAGSAAYVAELEDLITRVDSELSDTPDAPELWSQRVNLLLDLEVLFRHRFDEEYGRMASL